MWPRRHLHQARGDAPEGNVRTKRIESEDMNMDACARQQVKDNPTPVTTIWKWSTPEEASAFLEGVEWVNDGALTAWIDREEPSDVLVHDEDIIEDSDEWPIVRHGSE